MWPRGWKPKAPSYASHQRAQVSVHLCSQVISALRKGTVLESSTLFFFFFPKLYFILFLLRLKWISALIYQF